MTITGKAGAGKTTLAEQCAYAYIQNLPSANDNNHKQPIIWKLDAETLGQLLASYEQLAIKLKIEDIQKSPDDDYIKYTRSLADKVNKALEAQLNTVLIFDDAIDYASIKPYLPPESVSNIQVIVTTQQNKFFNIQTSYHKTIDISEGLTSTEGVELLKKFKLSKQDTDKEAEELVKHLKGLPLALKIAAHYIIENDLTYSTYLQELKTTQYANEYLRAMGYDKYQITAIYLSVNKAIETILKDEDMKDLWLFCSLLNSKYIPYDLLSKYINIKFSEENRIKSQYIYEISKKIDKIKRAGYSQEDLEKYYKTYKENLLKSKEEMLEKILKDIEKYYLLELLEIKTERKDKYYKIFEPIQLITKNLLISNVSNNLSSLKQEEKIEEMLIALLNIYKERKNKFNKHLLISHVKNFLAEIKNLDLPISACLINEFDFKENRCPGSFIKCPAQEDKNQTPRPS